MLPPGASPRAWNSAFSGVGAGGGSGIAKRKGVRMVNATPISSSPAILGQIDYKRYSAGALTAYHLLVSDNGRFDKKNSDNTTSAADGATPAPFTSGTLRPDWAEAKNYLYLVNGTDKKKFDGTTVWNFGTVKPAAAPTVADSGVAGTPIAGTYQGVTAFYNANTGHYSSRSAANSVTTASARQIDITWVASADPQVTHVAVGIRNTGSQQDFWEVTKVAIGTLTFRVNVDPTLLTTIFPNTTENDPPPAGITAIEWYATASRLFATDGQQVYYSKKDQPEAFDSLSNGESVGKNDGQLITALHATQGVLLIFKRHSVYALRGTDPESWVIEQLDGSIGAVSTLALFTVGGVTWWMSEQGPCSWSSGPVTRIGSPFLLESFSSDYINFASLDGAQAAPDIQRKRVLFALPEAGAARNTYILPFNYDSGAWESNLWNPLDVSSLAAVDEAGVSTVFIGGYKGQLFRLWDTNNDGVPSGTKTGAVTAATTSTLTDSTAAFVTTGGGLIERYVTAIDPVGTHVQRRRITANTATQLTITPNWSTTPSSVWTYAVGGPDFQVDTPWRFLGQAFIKKRLRFLFLYATSTTSSVTVNVDLFTNWNLVAAVRTFATVISGVGSKWDAVKWDSGAKWGGSQQFIPNMKRIAKTAINWRARFRNNLPDQDITLWMTSMSAEALSDNL